MCVPVRKSVFNGRQREERNTTGDNGRQRVTTEDNGRQRETMGDNGRQRETMGDKGRQWRAQFRDFPQTDPYSEVHDQNPYSIAVWGIMYF